MARKKGEGADEGAEEIEQAEAPDTQAEAPDTSDHVEMKKLGEDNIHVHPDTVAEHVKLGWQQA